MFRRDAGLPRLRDERVAHLYNKSLLLRILFVVLNDFWISNDDFGFIKTYSKSICSVETRDSRISETSGSPVSTISRYC